MVRLMREAEQETPIILPVHNPFTLSTLYLSFSRSRASLGFSLSIWPRAKPTISLARFSNLHACSGAVSPDPWLSYRH